MKLKWFTEEKVDDVNKLRTEYKKLLVKWHPDNNKRDTTEVMQEINQEYGFLFEKLRMAYSKTTHAKDNDFVKQHYDWKKDENLRKILWKLSTLEGITIEVCGIWIWVSGDTTKYKHELSSWGLRWAQKKKMWYVHFDDTYYKRSHKTFTMEQIRENYGSENVTNVFKGKKKLQYV